MKETLVKDSEFKMMRAQVSYKYLQQRSDIISTVWHLKETAKETSDLKIDPTLISMPLMLVMSSSSLQSVFGHTTM